VVATAVFAMCLLRYSLIFVSFGLIVQPHMFALGPHSSLAKLTVKSIPFGCGCCKTKWDSDTDHRLVSMGQLAMGNVSGEISR